MNLSQHQQTDTVLEQVQQFRQLWQEDRENVEVVRTSLKTMREHRQNFRRFLAQCGSKFVPWNEFFCESRLRTRALRVALLLFPLVASGQNLMPIAPRAATVPPAPATAAITLAWDRSPSPDVTGYRIYYGVASGTYTNSAAVGNTTNATLTGLLIGTRYYFAATAFNNQGESLFSNEVTGQAGVDRIVTITSRRATSIGGPWTNAAIVWHFTNSPLAALYVDHNIEVTNRVTWK